MLTLNWNIIWVVVNLLVLFVLLRIFLFKPVLNMIDKRKQTVQDTLDETNQKNLEAEKLKGQYEASLKSAREESVQIISDAKDRAQVQYNHIIDKANDDATQILHQANKAAESDRDRILRDAQSELASVALAAASKLLEKNVDEKSNTKILDTFLAEEAGPDR